MILLTFVGVSSDPVEKIYWQSLVARHTKRTQHAKVISSIPITWMELEFMRFLLAGANEKKSNNNNNNLTCAKWNGNLTHSRLVSFSLNYFVRCRRSHICKIARGVKHLNTRNLNKCLLWNVSAKLTDKDCGNWRELRSFMRCWVRLLHVNLARNLLNRFPLILCSFFVILFGSFGFMLYFSRNFTSLQTRQSNEKSTSHSVLYQRSQL